MGKQWKQWKTLFWGAPKITADGDCCHEIKRCLILERKVMTNLDRILKSRDNTLPTKVHLVKPTVFPVVMYGWELDYKKSWAPKIDAFELWCWRIFLESLLDCKEIQQVHPKGNQSWIFIGRTDAEAETPILGHLMWRTDSFIWKDHDAGKDWRMRWLEVSPTQRTWVWANSGSWRWTGRPGKLQSMGCNITERLNWTDSS